MEDVVKRVKILTDCVYVIDLETLDGFTYANGGLVIEICICKVNEYLEIEKLYHALINPLTYPKQPKVNWEKSWIFKNSSLSPEIVLEKGLSFDTVKSQVSRILSTKYVTSYNRKFDIEDHINLHPWRINCKKFPCIMRCISSILGCKKYMKLKDAFQRLYGDIEFEWHSADADTLAASMILVDIYNKSPKYLATI